MIDKIFNKLGIELVLLPILVFVVVLRELDYMKDTMNFQIIIGFIFLFLFLIFILTIVESYKKIDLKIYKFALIILLIIITCLTIFFIAINNRFEISSKLIHDGALMSEIAANNILFEGKNPYSMTYYDTELYDWAEPDGKLEINGLIITNPALEHYIYLPLNFLILIPFIEFSELFNIIFDFRIILIIFWLASIFIIFKFFKNINNIIKGVILFALNPLLIENIAFGMNDIIILFWILLCCFCLYKKKLLLATLVIALACMFKQTAWLFIPFYLVFLFFVLKNENKLKNIYIHFLVLLISVVVVLLPFIIWDFGAFFDDIINYPLSRGDLIYPISGYSFSNLLLQLNIIDNPFSSSTIVSILQIVFGLGLFIYYIRFIKKNLKISNLILFFSVWLLVFWYFSKFFNPNYITFIITLIVFSYLFYLKEKEIIKLSNKQ